MSGQRSEVKEGEGEVGGSGERGERYGGEEKGEGERRKDI